MPAGDLMAFLHTLENVFDHYCDRIAESQGAMLMAAHGTGPAWHGGGDEWD